MIMASFQKYKERLFPCEIWTEKNFSHENEKDNEKKKTRRMTLNKIERGWLIF